MDIPLGTVMSRLHRGRKQLREMLKDVARDQGIGLDHADMQDSAKKSAKKAEEK